MKQINEIKSINRPNRPSGRQFRPLLWFPGRLLIWIITPGWRMGYEIFARFHDEIIARVEVHREGSLSGGKLACFASATQWLTGTRDRQTFCKEEFEQLWKWKKKKSILHTNPINLLSSLVSFTISQSLPSFPSLLLLPSSRSLPVLPLSNGPCAHRPLPLSADVLGYGNLQATDIGIIDTVVLNVIPYLLLRLLVDYGIGFGSSGYCNLLNHGDGYVIEQWQT